MAIDYKKTKWVTGKTPLSAENLNNIEDGVKEVCDKALTSEDGVTLNTNQIVQGTKTFDEIRVGGSEDPWFSQGFIGIWNQNKRDYDYICGGTDGGDYSIPYTYQFAIGRLTVSDIISKWDNQYGLEIPDSDNWTSNKIIATTDDCPNFWTIDDISDLDDRSKPGDLVQFSDKYHGLYIIKYIYFEEGSTVSDGGLLIGINNGVPENIEWQMGNVHEDAFPSTCLYKHIFEATLISSDSSTRTYKLCVISIRSYKYNNLLDVVSDPCVISISYVFDFGRIEGYGKVAFSGDSSEAQMMLFDAMVSGNVNVISFSSEDSSSCLINQNSYLINKI